MEDRMKDENGMVLLTDDEAAELIIEAEEVVEAIRDGKMDGEYFEF